jgi:predicted O-linked N-acetylglucosamine transferase (SPINDLY family)
LSRFLRDHTIGHLGRGVIAHLSRKKFLVHLFALGRADDPIVDFLRRHADRFQNLPLDVAGAARAVAGDRLDVLCYLDLGMDPVAQGLAHLRLAPVQCATWGHPVTTGLPTIDYFISSALLEDADAQQHYTETLVRLETLGLYLYRPELAGPAPSRADFGLPGDKHLYACLQSLPKLHPDFDLLAGRILRRDPQAELVLLSGPSAEGERLLRQRFAASIPDVQQRVRFVPRQTAAGFFRLTACMDVLLDPPSFSGGKTSYEALALGRPVVTLPSPYLRGRITYGMYRAMGVYDCLAGTPAEYVEMALRLGTDADYRRAVGDKIRSAAGRLFEDLAAVRAWEEFLVRAAERGYTR